jgi:hypothetical protein
MKILNLVLAVMFLAFAFLQINDPDPVLWILIYGIMAVVCVLAAFNLYYRIVLIVLLVAYVGFSLVYLPGVKEWLAQDDRSVLFDDLAKMEHLFIEESREFLGLMICAAVLIFQLVRARRHPKRGLN